MPTIPFLKAGDTIAMCSIARKITTEELAPCIATLESWGLKVHLADTIDSNWHQFAGDDATRLNDLQNLLDNPEVKAILGTELYPSQQLGDQRHWNWK